MLPGAGRGVQTTLPSCPPHAPHGQPCHMTMASGPTTFPVNDIFPVPHRGEQPYYPTGVYPHVTSHATENPYANPDITPSTEESHRRGVAAFTLGEKAIVYAIAFLLSPFFLELLRRLTR